MLLKKLNSIITVIIIITYLSIWTLDRANQPRFVLSTDLANDIVYMVLIAVHFVEILKATTNGNRMQMDCQIVVMLEVVACWKTFHAALSLYCCYSMWEFPIHGDSWMPAHQYKQSDCGLIEDFVVLQRLWTFALIWQRSHYLISHYKGIRVIKNK